ncbi:MAG: hypothetical protein ABIK44_06735 [candidate division WOR-3 bacterium]
MKIYAIALADEAQRFVKGYPPKGAYLFLRPNLEICRLATLITQTDSLTYLDERIEQLDLTDEKPELTLIHVDLNQDEPARSLVERLNELGLNPLLFGPGPSRWREAAPEWARHYVKGDITAIWQEIRADAERGSLKPVYRAPRQPKYVVPKAGLGRWPQMNTRHQTINFIRGCACPESVRPFCSEFLYFDHNLVRRTKEEIVGEVISLPGKFIQLLDEDVARFPDYYYDIFRTMWDYRRHWMVNASTSLFRHPELIQLLAKAGVKVVYLNETFLEGRLAAALTSPTVVHSLYRQVKFLQSRRMLVACRLLIRLDQQPRPDFNLLADVLRRIDLDFIEPRFITRGPDGIDRLVSVNYRPMLDAHDPAWIRSRFYSLGQILNRLIRRPRRVGFYSTLLYLLPYSFAYRQNFLEGLT